MNQKLEQFGALLREFRKAKGWSQTKLSQKSGVSQPTISQYEKGNSAGQKQKILRLAAALELDSSQRNQLLLLAGHPPEFAAEDQFDLRASAALRIIAAVLNDEPLLELLKPLGEEPIATFAEGWQEYGLAKRAKYKRDWYETIRLCDEALTKIGNATDQLRAYLLDTVGIAQLHLGRLPDAESAYNQVESLISRIRDPYLQGLVYTHQGELYRSQSAWKQALDKFDAAVGKFTDIGDKAKYAWLQRKIGLVHLFMGDWQQGLNNLTQSATWFRQSADHYELAKVFMALGWAYSLKGDWGLMLRYRQEALRLATEHRVFGQYPDKYLQLQAHLYYGYDCRMLGRYQEAEYHLFEADKISKELQEQKERGLVLLGLARLYMSRCQQGKDFWKKAESTFKQAVEEHSTRQDRLRHARTLTHWATFYLHTKRKDVEKALKLLDEAKSRFQALKHHYYLAEVAIHLGEAYRLRRDFSSITELVDGGIQEANAYIHSYYRQLARLKLVKARAAIDSGYSDEALEHFAEALLDAVRFNRYQCREVAKEINEGVRILDTKQTSRKTAEDCRVLLQRFEAKLEKNKEYAYSIEQIKDAADLKKWLGQLQNHPTSSFI
jgi:transcriptional regulator with XRE-family HTH domain